MHSQDRGQVLPRDAFLHAFLAMTARRAWIPAYAVIKVRAAGGTIDEGLGRPLYHKHLESSPASNHDLRLD